MSKPSMQLTALDHVPLVTPGQDLAALLEQALTDNQIQLQSGDILVLAQKILSKAENRYVNLADVVPSAEAVRLAGETEKDPRAVELILQEANEVVRYRPGVIIVEHRLGYVMANAGMDSSNVEDNTDDSRVLLLPKDPDATAAALHRHFLEHHHVNIGIVVNDSVGRAWRSGTVGIALGAAGLPALLDLRGALDMFGRPLQVSMVGFADEIAAAASLIQGQGNEGRPIVHIRGLAIPEPVPGTEATAASDTARALIRDKSEDLFR